MAEQSIPVAQTLPAVEAPTSPTLGPSIDSLITPPDSGPASPASSSPSIPNNPPTTPVPSQALTPTPKRAGLLPSKSPARVSAAPIAQMSPFHVSRRPVPARSPLTRVRAGAVRKTGVSQTPLIDRLRRDTRCASSRLATMAQLLHATIGQYRRALEGQIELNETVKELTRMADEMRPFIIPWCDQNEDALPSSESDEDQKC